MRGLPNLECLNLAGTKVTADGLASLVAQTKLRVLWLDDKQANDAGKQHLRELTGLKWLVVENRRAKDVPGDLFELQTRQQKFTWRIADISAIEESVSEWEETGVWEPALTVTRF